MSDQEFPGHVPMTFHKGRVTDNKGEENPYYAYVTYGSGHGENADDAEIEISGGGSLVAGSLIATIPDMVAVLRGCEVILRGRDQRPDEKMCFDAVRGVLAKVDEAIAPR